MIINQLLWFIHCHPLLLCCCCCLQPLVLVLLLPLPLQVPVAKLIYLLILFAGVLCLTVLKGGGHVSSPIGIVCGSWEFWMLSLVALPWVFGFCIVVRRVRCFCELVLSGTCACFW